MKCEMKSNLLKENFELKKFCEVFLKKCHFLKIPSWVWIISKFQIFENECLTQRPLMAVYPEIIFDVQHFWGFSCRISLSFSAI